MSTHEVTLYGEDTDEARCVHTLGRVLSRYKDALPDKMVTSDDWQGLEFWEAEQEAIEREQDGYYDDDSNTEIP